MTINKILKKNFIYILLSLFLKLLLAFVTIFISVCLEKIINESIASNIKNLTLFLLLGIGDVILYGLMLYISSKFDLYLTKKIINIIKINLLRKIMNFNFEEFSKNEPSYYLNFVNNEIENFEQQFLAQFFSLLENFVLFLISFVYLCFISLYLAIFYLVSSVLLLLVPTIFNKKMNILYENFNSKRECFISHIKDIFSCFSLIKYLSLEDNETKNIKKEVEVLNNSRYKFQTKRELSNSLVSFFGLFIQLVAFGIGGYLTINSKLNIGLLISASQLSNSVINPLILCFIAINSIFSAKNIVKRINSFLKFPEHRDLNELNIQFKTFEVENLSFSYKNRVIFDNFNLKVNRGEKILIIGESGRGKTTLMKILTGLLTTYSGKIKINGLNLKENLKNLYKTIGYVSQDSYILNDTIKQNILLGKNCSKEKFFQTLDEANLKDFVESLELKENTILSENGANLSGGQKTRINLARILLIDPQIYLLDEISSSLDKENDIEIHKKLFSKKDRTIIEISHKVNPNIMENYDRVIKL